MSREGPWRSVRRESLKICSAAVEVFPPSVLIDKFLEDAIEIDVDAVAMGVLRHCRIMSILKRQEFIRVTVLRHTPTPER